MQELIFGYPILLSSTTHGTGGTLISPFVPISDLITDTKVPR